MSRNKGIYRTLRRAVRSGDAAGVEQALSRTEEETKSKLLSIRDSFGDALLHTAAKRGCAEVLGALLDGGADMESPGGEAWSPLIAACAHGRVECAEVLLRRGSEVDARDDLSRTALFHACLGSRMRGVADCARLLVRNGAEAEAEDSFGATPLDCLPPQGEDWGTRAFIEDFLRPALPAFGTAEPEPDVRRGVFASVSFPGGAERERAPGEESAPLPLLRSLPPREGLDRSAGKR